jgi:hypothetical protein
MRYAPYLILKMSVNDLLCCVLRNLSGNRLLIVIKAVLTAFIGKTKSTRPLPHLDNERQQSVNDFWPCIMVNESTKQQILSINEVLTVFVG